LKVSAETFARRMKWNNVQEGQEPQR